MLNAKLISTEFKASWIKVAPFFANKADFSHLQSTCANMYQVKIMSREVLISDSWYIRTQRALSFVKLSLQAFPSPIGGDKTISFLKKFQKLLTLQHRPSEHLNIEWILLELTWKTIWRFLSLGMLIEPQLTFCWLPQLRSSFKLFTWFASQRNFSRVGGRMEKLQEATVASKRRPLRC